MLDKGMFKDALVGMYEFDVAFIYFMKQHALLHQWLAMTNPESENPNEVTGYMKISISIATAGDEQIQIQEEVGAKDDEKIMMSPALKPEFYQLRFRFYRAEKLPSMDFAMFGKGSLDAYVICTYMKQKLKTKVLTQKEGGSIDWNQEFLMPVQVPIMSSRVVMKLFDEDKISDEIVGSLLFNLKECVGPKNHRFFWKNVYGSPLGVSGDNTKKMNANPEAGSTWKGRILIGVDAVKSEKPLLKVMDLEEEVIDQAAPYTEPHDYDVIAEVGMGIALPSDNKYKVKIQIAEHEWISEKPAFQEGNYCRWNFRFDQKTISLPYQDVFDIGKIFVYLLDGDKPICYFKDSVKNFLDPNPRMKYYPLINDLAIGKVDESHKAGFVSFKLAIHDKTKNGPIDFKSMDAWKTLPAKRPGRKLVRAYIYQCRDLPAADSDGTSDPYIVVWDTEDKTKKTVVIEDNLNPIYYQTLELTYEASTVDELPAFIFDVYDYDGLNPLDADDFIARAVIPIRDEVTGEINISYSENDEIPRPKWHPMRLHAKAPPCGEVLVSFSIVPDDYAFQTPLKYVNLSETVPTDEYFIDTRILGLRGLQSVGILPVKKAFIQFNLKSLVPPDLAGTLTNKETQPSDPGPNPTINTQIIFNMPLPSDSLFCPRLSCMVYDYIFKGFNQPLIGNFIIPIGDLMLDLQEERRTELAAIQKINDELEKIIRGEGVPGYNVQDKKHDSLIVKEATQEMKDTVNTSIQKNDFQGEGDNLKKGLLSDFQQDKPLEQRKPTNVSQLLE